jgi:hypothetical protein
MNKDNFCYVLQAAIWAYDGASEEELTTKYQIPEAQAHLGFQVYKKLNPN